MKFFEKSRARKLIIKLLITITAGLILGFIANNLTHTQYVPAHKAQLCGENENCADTLAHHRVNVGFPLVHSKYLKYEAGVAGVPGGEKDHSKQRINYLLAQTLVFSCLFGFILLRKYAYSWH